jgi:hypothetical protein
VEEAFKLIEDYKEPVFVEEDENAKEIWKQFTTLMEATSQRPNRGQLLQLRYEMEQYMIGVSEKDVKKRIYKKHLGFIE